MFNLSTFTHLHVAISLVAILSGLVVMFGLLTGRLLIHWTSFFLLTTVVTGVTGFFFPFHGFTPAIGGGIVLLIVLALAIFARYPRRLAGAWRWIYAVTATFALYLSVFALIAESFQNIPKLQAMAPTLTETPFLVTQAIALILFVVLGIVAAIRFRPPPVPI
ncbi:MAG: hypothetical protein ACRD9S_17365 [Pyrinomonadaceae bacterium]